MGFKEYWERISPNFRLRLTRGGGIEALAKSLLEMTPEERQTVLNAMDADDAPDFAIHRIGDVRLYANKELGGVPEDVAVMAKLASYDNGGDLVLTPKAHAAPASHVVQPVEPKGPAVAEKHTAEHTAQPAPDAYTKAVREANAGTPARKSARLVPPVTVGQFVNGVPESAYERLEYAPFVETVAQLRDLLLREGCSFVTGQRFCKEDDVVLVNGKALALRKEMREYARAKSWHYVGIAIAKSARADFADFMQVLPNPKIAELEKRLRDEISIIRDDGMPQNEKATASCWIGLLKHAIFQERKAAENAKVDELLVQLRDEYTSRDAVQARQKKIQARHQAIKEALDGLKSDDDDKAAAGASRRELNNERNQLSLEFQALHALWQELPSSLRPGKAVGLGNVANPPPQHHAPECTCNWCCPRMEFSSKPKTERPPKRGSAATAMTKADHARNNKERKAERAAKRAAHAALLKKPDFGASMAEREKKGKSDVGGKKGKSGGHNDRRAVKRGGAHS